jgi:heme exporter protein C
VTAPAAAGDAGRKGNALIWVSLALLVALGVRALAFTPTERVQGLAQKIFYIHVPSAWAAFLAFTVVSACSIGYLVLKDERLDLFAAASAEVGVVFTTAVLVTGPIWAKPIWVAWWTWDARLTSTLFLWFIFFGYLVMRSAVREPGQRARYSAVLGILGAPLVVFIHLSVTLFRTTHPQPVVLKPQGPTLPGEMLTTLLFGVAVLTVFYVALTRRRYALARAELARARAQGADDAA